MTRADYAYFYLAVPHHLITAASALNIAIVASDHRLAPQAKLPDVLKDCIAIVEYIRSDDFAGTTESKCDASKICLAGASAGKWLYLIA
jgi:acetyl esterase/lipase